MLNRIHQKLGTAGFVISIVALVAALGGGAYAASGGLNGKQKKEVEKIAKKFAGKTGAAGATGPAGAQGPQGAAGANGKDGSNGANGAPGAAGLPGAKGEPGPLVTQVPSKKTLKGAWSVGGEGAQLLASISFPFAVSPAPNSVIVRESGELGFLVESTGFKEALAGQEAIEAFCPGSAASPEAKPGNLCVYTEKEESGTEVGFQLSKLVAGWGNPSEYGASVPVFNGSGEAKLAKGTWAVTAP